MRKRRMRRAIRGACAASPFCAGCAPTPERRSEVVTHMAWEQEIAAEIGVPVAGAMAAPRS
jgi:hypothetical protein